MVEYGSGFQNLVGSGPGFKNMVVSGSSIQDMVGSGPGFQHLVGSSQKLTFLAETVISRKASLSLYSYAKVN